jgi:hypothetical protein
MIQFSIQKFAIKLRNKININTLNINQCAILVLLTMVDRVI